MENQSLRKPSGFQRSSRYSHRYVRFGPNGITTFTTSPESFANLIAELFGRCNASIGHYFKQKCVQISTLLFSSQMMGLPAMALPSGWRVVSGQVEIEARSKELNVNASSRKAIINYDRFDVDRDETVRFSMPDLRSSILNRVIGTGKSSIQGKIFANGQLLLVNPNGIHFASTAQLQVGSLIASTLHISDQDYLNGILRFTRSSDQAPGQIINEGSIETAQGGTVVLAASQVTQAGTINSPGGSVHLAVGDTIEVQMDDGVQTKVFVDEALKEKVKEVTDAIRSNGKITAETVKLQAKLKDQLYEKVVNHSGIIQATDADFTEGGPTIVLEGNVENGTAHITNTGTLSANATQAGQTAGSIQVSGDIIDQHGIIQANGLDYTNAGAIHLDSREATNLKSGSITQARGIGEESHGGDIIVWSDGNTTFEQGATMDVQGGQISGDGGFVEISGAETVYVQGQAFGGASQGQAGRILIDPTNIVIGGAGPYTAPTGNNGDPTPDETLTDHSGQTITFDPSPGGSFNGFGDIYLQATNDITVSSAFDTSLAAFNDTVTPVNLTLEAQNNININAAVTTHNANITLISESDGGSTGSLNVNGTLTSNGGNITLKGTRMDINQSINSGTGTVTLQSTSNSKNIQLFGATDNADSGTLLDISQPEMNRITTSQLNIGSSSNTGTTTLAGNVNISGTGAGKFNTAITNGGTISGSNRTYTLGTNLLNLTTPGTVSITSTTNSRPINISNISAGTLTLTTSGSNSPITITGNASATGNVNITASNATGSNISIGGNLTQTGGTSFTLTTGTSATKTINIGGTLSINNSAGKNVTMYTGQGNLFSNTFFNNPLSFNTIDLRSYGANNPITLGGSITSAGAMTLLTNATGSNISLTDVNSTGALSITTANTNSSILISGNVMAANNLTMTTANTGSNISIGGNLTQTGGTTFNLSTGTVANRNINLTGLLSINNSASKNVTIQTGQGDIFTNAFFNSAHNFNAINWRSYGANTPITLGGDITAAGALTLLTNAASSGITTQNLTSSGALSITTASTSSSIQINGNVTASNNVTITTANTGSNINITGNLSQTGGTSFTLSTGNSASRNVDIGGNLTINNSASKSVTLYTGGGNLFTKNYFNSNKSYNSVDWRTYGNSNPISLTGNMTTAGNLTLQTNGTNSGITINGNTSVAGNVNVSTAATGSNILFTGNLTNTGGTSFSLSSGATATRNVDINGTLSISNSATKSVTMYTGGGNLFSNSYFTTTPSFSFNAMDWRTYGNNNSITLNGTVTSAGNMTLLTNGTGSNLNLNNTIIAGGTLNLQTLAGQNITTTTSTLNISANSDFTLNSTFNTNGVNLNLTADADLNNSGLLYLTRSQTLTNGDLTLRGSQVRIGSTVGITGGDLIIRPTTNKSVQIGTAGDHNDSATLFDISASEISRITAPSVEIGSSSNTGTMTIAGNLNLSGTGAGKFNLDLVNGGNITSTNQAFTLGSHTLNMTSTSGNITLSTSSPSTPLAFNNLSGNTIQLTTTGASSPISQSSGLITANNLIFSTSNGNIGSSSNPLDIQTNTLTINAGGDVYLLESNQLSLQSATVSGILDIVSQGSLLVSGNVSGNQVLLETQNGSITLNNSTISSTGLVEIDQGGTGTFELLNTSAVNSSAGDITVWTENYEPTSGSLTAANKITIAPNNSSSSIQIATASATGGLNLSQADLNTLHAATVQIGDSASSGDITLGDASLPFDFILSTTGSIFDETPTSDTTANLTLGPGKSVTFTGGPGGSGPLAIGGTGLADIDILLSGGGVITIGTSVISNFVNSSVNFIPPSTSPISSVEETQISTLDFQSLNQRSGAGTLSIVELSGLVSNATFDQAQQQGLSLLRSDSLLNRLSIDDSGRKLNSPPSEFTLFSGPNSEIEYGIPTGEIPDEHRKKVDDQASTPSEENSKEDYSKILSQIF